MPKDLGTFVCAHCKRTFKKTVSDEEAMAEALAIWPQEEIDKGIDMVCETCYQAMLDWAKKEGITLI